MNIPLIDWHDAIGFRHSCRQYNGKSLSNELLEELVSFSEILNKKLPGARVVIVPENPDKVFKGIVGSYGKIKNAPAYVAFIGDMKDNNIQEKVGYIGECFILEATAKGLSTCWVGGFFRPEEVENQIAITPDEKVLAVSPIGYSVNANDLEDKLMKGIAASHKRKSLDSLCKGLEQKEWPEWVRKSLEAARLAPSAINRQPWRFIVHRNAIKVSIDSQYLHLGVSKRLDCGIAMLHIEVGALSAGIIGNWEYLQGKDVAIFRVNNS